MVWGLNGNQTVDLTRVGPLLERVERWTVLGLIDLACLAALILVLRALFSLVGLIISLRQKYVLFEITPPAGSMTQALATSEFFTILHGLSATKPLRQRLSPSSQTFALEIISTRQTGIRFFVRVPEMNAATLEQMIFSYLPDAKVQRIEESVNQNKRIKVVSFRQTGHFAFPIGSKTNLTSHDPIAYITGAMTQLDERDRVGVQYIVRPTSENQARHIRAQLLVNADVLQQIGGRKQPSQTRQKLLWLISDLGFSVLDGIGEIVSPTTRRPVDGSSSLASQSRQAELGLRPLRVLSASEQQLLAGIEQKVKQPLYRVDVRGFAESSIRAKRAQRISALKTAFSSFDAPGYQSIRAKVTLLPWLARFVLAHRLTELFKQSGIVLSSSELGDLFHFPYSGTSRVDNVVTSLSKTLPAPVSLKNNPELDVLVGVNVHHDVTTPIGLTAKERERHMYIVGGTGNGKTTMLQYQIIQDMQNGKGVAVIDPHGDLAEDLLNYVPEERIKDVIYFNPDDLEYPIGMNILELDRTLEGDDLAREKDRITETVVSMFRKIFSEDDSGGHRIEYVIRNAVQTALTIEDSTLFTIYNLLNDPPYRRKITKSLKDENLKKFWKNEFGTAGDYQKVKMSGGITAKIGRFLFSEAAKRVLEQPKSTIDFSDIIDSSKILICNFSKGLIGEDTSELFGITVLAKLQLASLKRISQRREVRRPYFVYVDEFQNFATKSFVQILSEARKFGLFITMAQQTTSQQDDPQMVNTILANVGTVVAFRTANAADEKVLLPFFAPFLNQHELANLPSYCYYMRISAVAAQEPFTGTTTFSYVTPNNENAVEIIESSRKNYAVTYLNQDIPPQKLPLTNPAKAKRSSKKRSLINEVMSN